MEKTTTTKLVVHQNCPHLELNLKFKVHGEQLRPKKGTEWPNCITIDSPI